MELSRFMIMLLTTLTLALHSGAVLENTTPPNIVPSIPDSTRAPIERATPSSVKRSVHNYDDPFTKSPVPASEDNQDRILQSFPTAASDATDERRKIGVTLHTEAPRSKTADHKSGLQRSANDLETGTSSSTEPNLDSKSSSDANQRRGDNKVTQPAQSTFSGNPHFQLTSGTSTSSHSNSSASPIATSFTNHPALQTDLSGTATIHGENQANSTKHRTRSPASSPVPRLNVSESFTEKVREKSGNSTSSTINDVLQPGLEADVREQKDSTSKESYSNNLSPSPAPVFTAPGSTSEDTGSHDFDFHQETESYMENPSTFKGPLSNSLSPSSSLPGQTAAASESGSSSDVFSSSHQDPHLHEHHRSSPMNGLPASLTPSPSPQVPSNLSYSEPIRAYKSSDFRTGDQQRKPDYLSDDPNDRGMKKEFAKGNSNELFSGSPKSQTPKISESQAPKRPTVENFPTFRNGMKKDIGEPHEHSPTEEMPDLSGQTDGNAQSEDITEPGPGENVVSTGSYTSDIPRNIPRHTVPGDDQDGGTSDTDSVTDDNLHPKVPTPVTPDFGGNSKDISTPSTRRQESDMSSTKSDMDTEESGQVTEDSDFAADDGGNEFHTATVTYPGDAELYTSAENTKPAHTTRDDETAPMETNTALPAPIDSKEPQEDRTPFPPFDMDPTSEGDRTTLNLWDSLRSDTTSNKPHRNSFTTEEPEITTRDEMEDQMLDLDGSGDADEDLDKAHPSIKEDEVITVPQNGTQTQFEGNSVPSDESSDSIYESTESSGAVDDEYNPLSHEHREKTTKSHAMYPSTETGSMTPTPTLSPMKSDFVTDSLLSADPDMQSATSFDVDNSEPPSSHKPGEKTTSKGDPTNDEEKKYGRTEDEESSVPGHTQTTQNVLDITGTSTEASANTQQEQKDDTTHSAPSGMAGLSNSGDYTKDFDNPERTTSHKPDAEETTATEGSHDDEKYLRKEGKTTSQATTENGEKRHLIEDGKSTPSPTSSERSNSGDFTQVFDFSDPTSSHKSDNEVTTEESQTEAEVKNQDLGDKEYPSNHSSTSIQKEEEATIKTSRATSLPPAGTEGSTTGEYSHEFDNSDPPTSQRLNEETTAAENMNTSQKPDIQETTETKGSQDKENYNREEDIAKSVLDVTSQAPTVTEIGKKGHIIEDGRTTSAPAPVGTERSSNSGDNTQVFDDSQTTTHKPEEETTAADGSEIKDKETNHKRQDQDEESSVPTVTVTTQSAPNITETTSQASVTTKKGNEHVIDNGRVTSSSTSTETSTNSGDYGRAFGNSETLTSLKPDVEETTLGSQVPAEEKNQEAEDERYPDVTRGKETTQNVMDVTKMTSQPADSTTTSNEEKENGYATSASSPTPAGIVRPSNSGDNPEDFDETEPPTSHKPDVEEITTTEGSQIQDEEKNQETEDRKYPSVSEAKETTANVLTVTKATSQAYTTTEEEEEHTTEGGNMKSDGVVTTPSTVVIETTQNVPDATKAVDQSTSLKFGLTTVPESETEQSTSTDPEAQPTTSATSPKTAVGIDKDNHQTPKSNKTTVKPSEKSSSDWSKFDIVKKDKTLDSNHSGTIGPQKKMTERDDQISVLFISVSVVVLVVALIAIIVTCVCYNNSDSLRRMNYTLGGRSGQYQISDEIALGTPGRLDYKGDHAYKNYYGHV